MFLGFTKCQQTGFSSQKIPFIRCLGAFFTEHGTATSFTFLGHLPCSLQLIHKLKQIKGIFGDKWILAVSLPACNSTEQRAAGESERFRNFLLFPPVNKRLLLPSVGASTLLHNTPSPRVILLQACARSTHLSVLLNLRQLLVTCNPRLAVSNDFP